jgi:hypothetical protein
MRAISTAILAALFFLPLTAAAVEPDINALTRFAAAKGQRAGLPELFLELMSIEPPPAALYVEISSQASSDKKHHSAYMLLESSTTKSPSAFVLTSTRWVETQIESSIFKLDKNGRVLKGTKATVTLANGRAVEGSTAYSDFDISDSKTAVTVRQELSLWRKHAGTKAIKSIKSKGNP